MRPLLIRAKGCLHIAINVTLSSNLFSRSVTDPIVQTLRDPKVYPANVTLPLRPIVFHHPSLKISTMAAVLPLSRYPAFKTFRFPLPVHQATNRQPFSRFSRKKKNNMTHAHANRNYATNTLALLWSVMASSLSASSRSTTSASEPALDSLDMGDATT